MLFPTFKPQHKGTIVDQILTIKSISNYHKKEIVPHLESMEAWEAKEYINCEKIRLAEIEALKNFMLENESVCNEILHHYNLSTVVFIAKYINA